jgi:hypothetical protein
MMIQEPRITSYEPNSYYSLHLAFENGWQISHVELCPSWDQHGFLYVVTLYHCAQTHTPQIILPKNHLVDRLLDKYSKKAVSHQRVLQPLAI